MRDFLATETASEGRLVSETKKLPVPVLKGKNVANI